MPKEPRSAHFAKNLAFYNAVTKRGCDAHGEEQVEA
jgi:hypothetical protein